MMTEEERLAQNTSLIYFFAKRFKKKFWWIDIDDLCQMVRWAIILAHRSFDPDRKIKFSTHVQWKLKGILKDQICNGYYRGYARTPVYTYDKKSKHYFHAKSVRFSTQTSLDDYVYEYQDKDVSEIRKMIGRLTEKEQYIIMQVCIDQVSIREVAKTLNLTPRSLAQYKYVALKKLKEMV